MAAVWPIAFGTLLIACFASAAVAQQTPEQATEQNGAAAAIRKESNLIIVRAIVRDANGNPVGGLSQNDFELFDNKKAQKISFFLAETPEAANSPEASAGSEAKTSSATVEKPRGLTALFFDDYHMEFADLTQIRDAAKRYLTTQLSRGGQAGIYSASGSVNVDFTSDRDKLEQALSHLAFEPRFKPTPTCPKGNFVLPMYLAQRVEDMDEGALETAAGMVGCRCGPHCPEDALKDIARGEASRLIAYNNEGAVATIAALNALVARMALSPSGEATIAMVSDGFINEDNQQQLNTLIDRALRANVTISALDAKGLFVEPAGESAYERQTIERKDDVLSETAESTGGTFVHDTNDLESGLARIAALHIPFYVLGFVPEKLKFDGKFHTLTVKLAANSAHDTVQARRGYFAPKQAESAAADEDDELKHSIFFPDEANGVPVQFRTEFAKVGEDKTQITIIVGVDMHSLRFHKADDRNLDNLYLVAGIFDRRGTFITGQRKTLGLRLTDKELQQLSVTGATVSAILDAKPGAYQIRVALVDDGSQQLKSSSEEVNVP